MTDKEKGKQKKTMTAENQNLNKVVLFVIRH
jgi:hypothetical protein